MRLLTFPSSPFGCRVLIAAALKNLPLQVEAPEMPLKSDMFRQLNPIGKSPVLVLPDGESLYESQTIVDFLEEVRPAPALLPPDPVSRARCRALVRFVDLYLTEALRPFMQQALTLNRSETAEPTRLAHWRYELDVLTALLPSDGPFAMGPEPGYVDCALAPMLAYGQLLLPMAGDNDPWAGHPRPAALLHAAVTHPILGPLLDGLGQGFHSLRALRTGAVMPAPAVAAVGAAAVAMLVGAGPEVGVPAVSSGSA